MRPEARIISLEADVEELNARFADAEPQAVLAYAIERFGSKIAAVSSFGAESVALLDMVAEINQAQTVLFLDTEMLFPATIAYQQTVAETLGLSDVRVLKADRNKVFLADPNGTLNQSDPDLCCSIRKTEPLEEALGGFEAWITGRKRFQSNGRAALEFFEIDTKGRIKVNPLAHWSAEQVRDYIAARKLPKHPMVAEGFPSIGCAPCTKAVKPGEDARAGRWAGKDKTECGIHMINGRFVRRPVEGGKHA